jgi:hypothetical protein
MRMVTESANAQETQLPHRSDQRGRGRASSVRLVLVTIGLASLSTVAALFAARWLSSPASPVTPPTPTPAANPKPALFGDWPQQKPAVVFVLSGQEFGYIQKCGCSSPQLGGLERRYNFIDQLRQRGWPVIAMDLGDIAYQRGLREQALLKYALSMKALSQMGYVAVGVGKHEFDMPLLDLLAEFTLQQKPGTPPRVLAANLLNRQENFPFDHNTSMVEEYVIEGGKEGVPKVAVVGLVGASIIEQVAFDPQRPNLGRNRAYQFESNSKAIPRLLQQIAPQNPDVQVLLYQGSEREAVELAKVFPQFDVILCLSREDEPPGLPTPVGQRPGTNQAKTLIVSVGHKGRYVGVMGVFPTNNPANPWNFRYQLVPLGEEYETKPGADADQPILRLLQEYAQEIKDKQFLARQPQVMHPTQIRYAPQKVSYVGNDRCVGCHQAAAEVWDKSRHAHAYEALEHIATRPTLRNFDPECIVCHTVGFGIQTGYTTAEKTPHLKNVGCESCHGPGSLHTENAEKWAKKLEPLNRDYVATMSPWKIKPDDRLPHSDKLKDVYAGKQKLTPAEQQIVIRVSDMCAKCHDPDNDPHFRLEKYWPDIAHPLPRNNPAANP